MKNSKRFKQVFAIILTLGIMFTSSGPVLANEAFAAAQIMSPVELGFDRYPIDHVAVSDWVSEDWGRDSVYLADRLVLSVGTTMYLNEVVLDLSVYDDYTATIPTVFTVALTPGEPNAPESAILMSINDAYFYYEGYYGERWLHGSSHVTHRFDAPGTYYLLLVWSSVYNLTHITVVDPDAVAVTEPADVDPVDEPEPAVAEPAVAEPAETAAVTALPSSNDVLVDGEVVAFRAFNIGGNNFFMLRDIAYTLSGSPGRFEVIWDRDLLAINLLAGDEYTPVGGEMAPPEDTPASALLNTASVYVDGEVVNIRSYNIGGNNFFMLRDLGDALGFSVEWDAETASVLIATE